MARPLSAPSACRSRCGAGRRSSIQVDRLPACVAEIPRPTATHSLDHWVVAVNGRLSGPPTSRHELHHLVLDTKPEVAATCCRWTRIRVPSAGMWRYSGSPFDLNSLSGSLYVLTRDRLGGVRGARPVLCGWPGKGVAFGARGGVVAACCSRPLSKADPPTDHPYPRPKLFLAPDAKTREKRALGSPCWPAHAYPACAYGEY